MLPSQLAELAKLYDEYLHANPVKPETKQASFLFKALVQEIYAKESETYRQTISLSAFQNQVVIPAVNTYFAKNQTQFPTLTPERFDQP